MIIRKNNSVIDYSHSAFAYFHTFYEIPSDKVCKVVLKMLLVSVFSKELLQSSDYTVLPGQISYKVKHTQT